MRNRPTQQWLVSNLLLTSLLLTSLSVFAEVPHLIRYQGQVADSQDVPLEGPYTLTFRLYDAEIGGTKLWEEVQPTIPLTGGHFSVLLGQVTALNVDWSQPCWLSIQVGTEPELSPRQRITSVPLAIRAEQAQQLNGQPHTFYLNRASHTGTQSPGSISPQGSGSGLDADMVDGQHAANLLNRSNHTGTQPASTVTGTFAPSVISPQGSGSGLNADLLDGQDSSAFATAGHRHSCVNRMGLPGGQTGNGFCANYGEWCVHNLTAGGRDTESCTTANPGFGDWGTVCCR